MTMIMIDRKPTARKRPPMATKEAGLKLREMGYSLSAIGKLWCVTKQRVWWIIYHQTKKPGRPKTVST